MNTEAKQASKEVLPEVTIGLCGHVDHGKTTLTYALTGKWTMLHSEELKRGITIKLGYADAFIRKCSAGHYTSEKVCPEHKTPTEIARVVSFVDAPGHETLMAVMLSGAAIMDGAILVVAANEPVPQPQTAEHLMALKVLGVQNIIIVQNKIDVVTKEKAIENYNQIRAFAKETLGRDVPIIPISGQRKANIDVLLEAIQELIPTPKRDDSKEPLMLVARSFDINKPGTAIEKLIGGVLGGAIVQGKFEKGMRIELRPGRKIEKKSGQVEWKPVVTTITGIAAGSTLVDSKGPGGSVALSTALDPALTKSDAFVGNAVGVPGKLPAAVSMLNIRPHLFDFVVGTKEKLKLEPFKQYEPLMLNTGTATTVGIVQSSSQKLMRLSLRRPVCARKGDKVSIARQVSARWHLIGYGIVL